MTQMKYPVGFKLKFLKGYLSPQATLNKLKSMRLDILSLNKCVGFEYLKFRETLLYNSYLFQ